MANANIIPAARVQEALKKADLAMAKLAKVRGKTEEKVGEVFKLAETVGGALAVGYFRGRYGEVQVGPGVPIEAVVGGALSLAAFVDLPGRYSEHLHNLGNGILGSWATIEALKFAGGTILSAEEVAQLRAGQVPALPEAPAPKAQETKQKLRETPLLVNGVGRPSARESFADNPAESEVERTPAS